LRKFIGDGVFVGE